MGGGGEIDENSLSPSYAAERANLWPSWAQFSAQFVRRFSATAFSPIQTGRPQNDFCTIQRLQMKSYSPRGRWVYVRRSAVQVIWMKASSPLPYLAGCLPELMVSSLRGWASARLAVKHVGAGPPGVTPRKRPPPSVSSPGALACAGCRAWCGFGVDRWPLVILLPVPIHGERRPCVAAVRRRDSWVWSPRMRPVCRSPSPPSGERWVLRADRCLVG